MCVTLLLLLTLYEVNEHLQISDLGFELFHQLLFNAHGVDDLCDGGVHTLSQLLGRQVPDVLVQVHVQLLNQLVDDHLHQEKVQVKTVQGFLELEAHISFFDA